MQLDFRTIFIENAAILSSLSIFTLVALGIKSRGQRYLKLWSLAFPFLLVGTLVVALRGIIPPIISIVLGNLAIVCGYAFLFEGMREFRGRGLLWKLDLALLALSGLGTLWFALVQPSTQARVMIISALALYYYFASGATILGGRRDWDARLALLCSAFLFLLAAVNAARFGLALAVGVPSDLLSASVWDSLIQIVVAASVVVVALSILFMHASRLNQDLAVASKDREVLFREMAHRTKNDLALVDSFISLEQSNLESDDLIGRLDMLRERIRCIAEAHDLLSRSSVSGLVRIDRYLEAIAKGIARGGNISLEIDFEEFDIDFPMAVNLGLIMNELATNSLKHAFRGRRAGTVKLSLGRAGEGAVLVVSDDGVGTLWPPAKEGLGGMIVKALVAKIDGEIQFRNEEGSSWRVSFPLPPSPLRLPQV